MTWVADDRRASNPILGCQGVQLRFLILAAGLLGFSALYREDPCGRQRSIKAQGQIPGAEPADSNATVYLVDQDSRFNLDAISWAIPVSINGDSVTAVHLHDRTPGNADRVVFITLFELVRAGQTYFDMHTASHPEGIAHANLTSVQFEDWSGYYCS